MAITKRTRRQIKEALAYWKKQLRKLNEETGGDGTDGKNSEGGENSENSEGGENPENDVDDDNNNIEFEEKDAKAPAAFAKFNPMSRIVRLHNAAVKKVQKLVADKFLNKWKAGDAQSILIENSAIDTDAQTFEYKKGNTMVITMSVSIDKAKVKGFRKMMAVLLKESTFKKLDRTAKQLNEGIWDIFKGAIGSAA